MTAPLHMKNYSPIKEICLGCTPHNFFKKGGGRVNVYVPNLSKLWPCCKLYIRQIRVLIIHKVYCTSSIQNNLFIKLLVCTRCTDVQIWVDSGNASMKPALFYITLLRMSLRSLRYNVWWPLVVVVVLR